MRMLPAHHGTVYGARDTGFSGLEALFEVSGLRCLLLRINAPVVTTLLTTPRCPPICFFRTPARGRSTRIVNLSTYGEWRYSMMGLAGRDPIFFAQLDTESTVHSNLKASPISRVRSGYVSCCHGVMGQRQYHLDKGNGPRTLFTRDQLNDPNSTVCGSGARRCLLHGMSSHDRPEPGRSLYLHREVSPRATRPSLWSLSLRRFADVKVGDNVIRVPMINSVGIVPVFGAQVGEAKLCASCHTIVLPVYDAKGKQVKTDFEQTTYFEWLNSSFASGIPNVPELPYARQFQGHEAGVPSRQHRGQHVPGGTRDWHTYIVAA